MTGGRPAHHNVIDRYAAGSRRGCASCTGPMPGMEIKLPAAGVVVGGHTGCDIVPADPAVSARHLTSARRARVSTSRTFGSRNGTFLDGVRLGAREVPRRDAAMSARR